MTINEAAARFVADMVDQFGARFEIAPDGARWFYEAGPGNAKAARAFVQAVDRHRPGFDAAVIAAVHRLAPRKQERA